MSTENSTNTIRDCSTHYRTLLNTCAEILNHTLTGECSQLHSESHNYVADCESWLQVLEDCPESEPLSVALREYQYALLALSLGQYRQAFMALRLYLELSLGTIHLSAHEVELRLWLRRERDIIWRTVVDENSGVFAKQFTRAFFYELSELAPQYRAIAVTTYRNCSEHVHANPGVDPPLPDSLIFSKDVVERWHMLAGNVRLVVGFAMTSRYLMVIPEESRNMLQHIVLDQLGHVAAVRSVYGAVTE